MLWLLTDDIAMYQEDVIKKDYKAKKVIFFPSSKTIYETVINSSTDELLETVFVSPDYPKKEDEKLFVVKKVYSKDMLSTQQKHLGIKEAEALKSRLGLTVTKSNLTLADATGNYELMQWAERVEIAKRKNYVIKPTFLLGVAGVGKSHFVVCYAGEKNIPMIDLNLTAIMEDERAIAKLNEVFEYLSDTNVESILRIDEIGQMLTSKEVIGEMLTILNDLNTKQGYRHNGLMFATENNIRDIIANVPQFFRHGRWNEKFFVHYLKEDAIKDVMRYYNKGYKTELSESQIDEIFYKSQEIYRDDNLAENRSVYVPSEINYLFERLSYYDNLNASESICSEAIEEEIKYVIPQYRSAKEGLAKLIGDAEKNYFRTI